MIIEYTGGMYTCSVPKDWTLNYGLRCSFRRSWACHITTCMPFFVKSIPCHRELHGKKNGSPSRIDQVNATLFNSEILSRQYKLFLGTRRTPTTLSITQANFSLPQHATTTSTLKCGLADGGGKCRCELLSVDSVCIILTNA